ncbi:PDZ domain-containing protein [Dethiosulfovibrio sp. F2B]|uniref:PDZ domain-containing protein n=1 Tax=Dethiosulfovibrio faecalis TaxID=2720018 RepID=UPI001F1BD60E|nr:PDZ domain-containing protein [Dethiosulfovibrio faecalis]MCF4150856.1 PDZ domain-containing protein [Dethiosulfovibrio faecalis]
MKKLLFALLAVLCITTAVSAASLYTVTINDTDTQAVQDAAIEIMTGKNFTIEEVTPYKAVFSKGFGDGFWTASRLCYVNLAFIERDGNVKVMVSETEKIGAIIRKRSINHLVPLVQQIKSTVDGTPVDQVQNEAVDQLPGSGNEREKALGLVLDDQIGADGIKIMSVDPGSLAEESGILAMDVLSEINGRETTSMTPSAVKTYLANKMAAKSSIMMIVTRGTDKKLFTIDPEE